jgi:putative peptidoglycan lipid II flippase
LDWKDAAVKKIVRLMIPRTIGMGADQILLIIYTAIASALAAGSIMSFSLANNIQTMPSVVFGTSFATAVFPAMARSISMSDKKTFAFYLNRSVRSIGFLLIPSSVIFILLRAQIVRLILGSGQFGWDDTRRTALVLGFFSISLLAQGLIPLLAKAFYALKNTRFPMFASIATLIISTIFAFPLSKLLGVSGLALSISLASFFDAGLLLLYLRRAYPDVWNKGVSLSYIKIIFASLIMGVAMHFSIRFFANVFNMDRFFGVLEQTVVTLVIAAVVYLGLSYLFGFEEMKWALTRKINGTIEEGLEGAETAEYEKK